MTHKYKIGQKLKYVGKTRYVIVGAGKSQSSWTYGKVYTILSFEEEYQKMAQYRISRDHDNFYGVFSDEQIDVFFVSLSEERRSKLKKLNSL